MRRATHSVIGHSMAYVLKYRDFPDAGGPLRVAEVPWDRELLGHSVHDVDISGGREADVQRELPNWLNTLKGKLPCLAVAKIDTAAVTLIRVLTRCGFYYVETQLSLSLDLAETKPGVSWETAGTRMRLGDAADAAALTQIATHGFVADRLHLDPNIADEAANRRYGAWVNNAIAEQEPLLIVEENNGTIIGFSHFREIDRQRVGMSLGAVAPAYQGTGAGWMLLDATLMECRRRGYAAATTKASLNNRQSVNLLLSRGFVISHASTTLHWFHGD